MIYQCKDKQIKGENAKTKTNMNPNISINRLRKYKKRQLRKNMNANICANKHTTKLFPICGFSSMFTLSLWSQNLKQLVGMNRKNLNRGKEFVDIEKEFVDIEKEFVGIEEKNLLI